MRALALCVSLAAGLVAGGGLAAATTGAPAKSAAKPASAPAPGPQKGQNSVNVWATAYNALDGQTDDTPHVGAWGDHLDEAVATGVRVIAVSPDLLEKGLTRGQRVRIHGLRGEFVVLDKMPSRWKNRIDIYMHKDVRAAKKWGKRRVKLSWRAPEQE